MEPSSRRAWTPGSGPPAQRPLNAVQGARFAALMTYQEARRATQAFPRHPDLYLDATHPDYARWTAFLADAGALPSDFTTGRAVSGPYLQRALDEAITDEDMTPFLTAVPWADAPGRCGGMEVWRWAALYPLMERCGYRHPVDHTPLHTHPTFEFTVAPGRDQTLGLHRATQLRTHLARLGLLAGIDG